MDAINIKELPVKDILGIWWGFFWRAMAITLCSMLAGGVLGGLFGFIIGVVSSAMGGSQEAIVRVARIAGGFIGLGVGAYSFYIYLRWLLNSKLGKYKLILLRADET